MRRSSLNELSRFISDGVSGRSLTCIFLISLIPAKQKNVKEILNIYQDQDKVLIKIQPNHQKILYTGISHTIPYDIYIMMKDYM